MENGDMRTFVLDSERREKRLNEKEEMSIEAHDADVMRSSDPFIFVSVVTQGAMLEFVTSLNVSWVECEY